MRLLSSAQHICTCSKRCTGRRPWRKDTMFRQRAHTGQRRRRQAALRMLNRPKEAATELQAELLLCPRVADTYTELARAQEMVGDCEHALEARHHATMLEPLRAPLQTELGHALLAAERPDEAVSAHFCALRLDPSLLESYHGMGQAYLAQKRPQAAADSYASA